MRIKKSIKDFLEYLEVAQNKSDKTLENYKHYLKRFEDFLSEDIDVKDITLRKIQNYRLYLNRSLDWLKLLKKHGINLQNIIKK